MLLTAHPLLPGSVAQHRRWCEQLRERRDEFGRSRRAVGIRRVTTWAQPSIDLVVVRVEADDPVGALDRLSTSATAFDDWYRACESEVHEEPLVAYARHPPEPIADHDNAPVDPFDPYLVMALPLLPGRSGEFRDTMARGVATGEGAERARRWGVHRLKVHLQPVAGRDVVIYEVTGDLGRMVRELSGDQTPANRAERDLFQHMFGVDLAVGDLPLPEPSFAWSDVGP